MGGRLRFGGFGEQRRQGRQAQVVRQLRRVRGRVDLRQLLDVDVRIDLRGVEVRVAQQRLDKAVVRLFLQPA